MRVGQLHLPESLAQEHRYISSQGQSQAVLKRRQEKAGEGMPGPGLGHQELQSRAENQTSPRVRFFLFSFLTLCKAACDIVGMA